MNQTHRGGFTQVESAFAFITAQVETYNKRKYKIRRQRLSLFRRFAAATTAIALILSMNVQQAKSEAETMAQASETVNPVFESSLRLDSQSMTPLAIEETKIEMKVGKSLAQLEAESRRRSTTVAKASNGSTASGRCSVERRYFPTEEAHRMAQEAAAKAGIPDQWQILAAIWTVETGKSEGCIPGMGGEGAMQFNPNTFNAHKPRPDASQYKAEDALHAAGNLLKRGGITENPDKAIFNYNHSMAYVAKVKRVANSIDTN